MGWLFSAAVRPKPAANRRFGANPNCPACKARLGTRNLIGELRLACYACKREFVLREWPVPADYLYLKVKK